MNVFDAEPPIDYGSSVDLLRWVLLGVTILIGLALLALILFGWRRRLRKHPGLAALPVVPELSDDATVLGGKYVATTAAEDPFDRIASRGLAFRGNALVGVHPSGVLIERTGETDLWIPREDLLAVDRATWTIDRVVERGGLQRLRWRLGDREVDTYLRMDEPRDLDAAIEGLELTKHA